jgi:RNA polymerase sigma-70 factor, ECF subfamily
LFAIFGPFWVLPVRLSFKALQKTFSEAFLEPVSGMDSRPFSGGAFMARAPGRVKSLIDAAKCGSKEALGELLERYRIVLKRKAHRHIGADLIKKVDTSEVVQETLFAAVREFPKFKGCSEDEIIGWLVRILVHRIQNLGKQFHSGKRDVGRETPLTKDIAQGLQMREPADENERERLLRVQTVAMRRSFAELPTDYQQVIRLHYREKMPFKEVGVVLQRSEEAVKKLWTRALRRWGEEAEYWQKRRASNGTRGAPNGNRPRDE